MNYKFTSIPEAMKYPPKVKGELSSLHANIIEYVSSHFQRNMRFKDKVLSLMNSVSYFVISGDTIPKSWNSSKPFENLFPFVDDDLCEELLGDLYLTQRNVTWDLVETEMEESMMEAYKESYATKASQKEVIESSTSKIPETKAVAQKKLVDAASSEPTPKEHLYIRPPIIPQFDVDKPYLRVNMNECVYAIYTSLPEIPTNQSEISITTDISKMSKEDKQKLYPNRLIHTRAPIMYEPYGNLELDSELGIIFPIEGFTSQQIRENIIKYPHIFKLMRDVDGKPVPFYTQLEVGGELKDILEVWESLPESTSIPRNSEYIKEYVVRRYLLERDILGIQHKYPIYGDFSEFLTLFSTQKDYKRWGYDCDKIVDICIQSRIDYKRSRNPILRMVNNYV